VKKGKTVTLAVVLTILTGSAACEPLPEKEQKSETKQGSTSKVPLVTMKLDCAMIGAKLPGYKWKLVVNENQLTIKYGAISADKVSYTPPAFFHVRDVVFEMEPVNPPIEEGFMKCTLLHTGPGLKPPFPIISESGLQRWKARVHGKVTK
jgi:hypothetical protein